MVPEEENRALPGRRNAKRIDATLGTKEIENRYGGEGNGNNDEGTPRKNAPEDTE